MDRLLEGVPSYLTAAAAPPRRFAPRSYAHSVETCLSVGLFDIQRMSSSVTVGIGAQGVVHSIVVRSAMPFTDKRCLKLIANGELQETEVCDSANAIRSTHSINAVLLSCFA